MAVTVSAPGKVTLFGEHAVVYGEPAIVASIDRRVYVESSPRSDDKVIINAEDLEVKGIILSYDTGGGLRVETEYGRALDAVKYIREAINVVGEYIGVGRGAELRIRSEMPVGAGLGTSAAVCVSTITAYAYSHGYKLELEEIARLSWLTEKRVQGIASPMDSTISTFGGVIYLTYDGVNFSYEEVETPIRLPVIIGYTRRRHGTGDMVRMVRDLLERYPDIVKPIIRDIGRIVVEARRALSNGDLREVGLLMNINHGLLDALGVSTRELNEMVYTARVFGAYGAKLSGAGGGGIVIALAPEDRVSDIMAAYKLMNVDPIETSLGGSGLEIEVE